MPQHELGLTLSDVAFVDELEQLAATYAQRHGRKPINVSHWDPSERVIAKLRPRLRVPPLGEPIRYRYSYTLARRDAAIAKLGFRAGGRSALITENGSTSTMLIANWLKFSSIREVVVLCPCYFIVPYNLARLGISVRYAHMTIEHGVYRLPSDLAAGAGQAIWITNPVYSTGMYLQPDDERHMLKAMDAGSIVVADECLAILPSRIASNLGGHARFVGIYTPHKALCVNALKFSAIVFASSEEESFEHWADVLCGGLGLSVTAALDHFLSTDYDDYQAIFQTLVQEVKVWHDDSVNQVPSARVDKGPLGHFVSVYFEPLAASLGADLNFLRRTGEDTGTIFLPGIRSRFDPALGFCFRINLAQDSPKFRAAVMRLYRYLDRISA